MSQTNRLDQMVAAAKHDIAHQCALARGEPQPSVVGQSSPRPQTVAELVAAAKREIASSNQAPSSLVSQSSQSTVALPKLPVEPFSLTQSLLGLCCTLDWGLVRRRLAVLSVLGLFAFLVFPERTPEARDHLVLMVGMVLSLAFVAWLFVVILWSIWRRN